MLIASTALFLLSGGFTPPALSDLLGDLAGASPPGPIVVPDTRASFVILRPLGEGALDVARLETESVLLDRRPPGGGD